MADTKEVVPSSTLFELVSVWIDFHLLMATEALSGWDAVSLILGNVQWCSHLVLSFVITIGVLGDQGCRRL